MQIIAADGTPVRVQGYAAVRGAQAGKLRISPRCSFSVMGDDCRFTIHHVDGVSLGSARAGTLRLWVDRIGLAFEADAIADTKGVAWGLQYLAMGKIGCSYLGREETRRSDDGATEITAIDLVDVCLSDNPTFASTAAWRSDAHWRDVPARALSMRDAHARTSGRDPVPFVWNYKVSAAGCTTPRPLARQPGARNRPAAAATPSEKRMRAWEAYERAMKATPDRRPRVCECGGNSCSCEIVGGGNYTRPTRPHERAAHLDLQFIDETRPANFSREEWREFYRMQSRAVAELRRLHGR